MKIQRYVAKDMRSALTQVREALGPDAVILSSGKVDEGVEVVAAIDFESQKATVEPVKRPEPARTHDRPTRTNTVRSVDFRQASQPKAAAPAPTPAAPKRASSQLSPDVTAEQQFPASSADATLAEEVKSMRRMLEAQLA